MRALIVSDLHIGQGASIPGRIDDQAETWAAALQLAVDERCDVVLFGGDAAESRTPDSVVRAAFQQPLVGYPLPVIAIPGNHDVKSDSVPTILDLAGQELGGGLLTSVRTPRLVAVGGLVVACVPWASVARLRAHLNGSAPADDADAMAGQLVIRIMEQLRAQAAAQHPGVPCVCLSHFATSGWRTPTGLPTDSIRDVVLPLGELERVGFDAVFLGHIHAPGVINDFNSSGRVHPSLTSEGIPGVGDGGTRQPSPIISLGSPLCLNHGEEHVEHGVWIVEFAPQMRREAPDVSFWPLDGRRFLTLDVTAEDVVDKTAVLRRLVRLAREDSAEVTGAIVRVRIKAGRDELRRLNVRAIEAAVRDAGAHHVKVDPVPTVESRARVAGVTAQLDPTDALELWIASLDPAPEPWILDGVRAWIKAAA